MNIDAKEFFPSNEIGKQSTTIDVEDHLLTSLKTGYQLVTARSILQEWNRASTLSALTHEWSSRHENQPSERSGFSLLLYNSSSLRLHLEDLIDYVSECYPSIWATLQRWGQRSTCFSFWDSIQHLLWTWFNSFGGVCLVIAREFPHRIASKFNNMNNTIAADVFNSKIKHTVAVVYSPPSKEVPIVSSFLTQNLLEIITW